MEKGEFCTGWMKFRMSSEVVALKLRARNSVPKCSLVSLLPFPVNEIAQKTKGVRCYRRILFGLFFKQLERSLVSWCRTTLNMGNFPSFCFLYTYCWISMRITRPRLLIFVLVQVHCRNSHTESVVDVLCLQMFGRF